MNSKVIVGVAIAVSATFLVTTIVDIVMSNKLIKETKKTQEAADKAIKEISERTGISYEEQFFRDTKTS